METKSTKTTTGTTTTKGSTTTTGTTTTARTATLPPTVPTTTRRTSTPYAAPDLRETTMEGRYHHHENMGGWTGRQEQKRQQGQLQPQPKSGLQ